MMKMLFKKKLEDGRMLIAYEDSATEAILFWGKPPNVEGSLKVAKDKLTEKIKEIER